jgi:NADPH2:quinone reductase
VTVVIDHVGAPVFPALIGAMTLGGRYVSVGRLGGSATELDLNTLARDRLQLVGATFRTRTIEEYADIATGVRANLMPAIAAGGIRALVADQYPIESANDVLDSLAAPLRIGKVTLLIDEMA